jgi:hypothetical protein
MSYFQSNRSGPLNTDLFACDSAGEVILMVSSLENPYSKVLSIFLSKLQTSELIEILEGRESEDSFILLEGGVELVVGFTGSNYMFDMYSIEDRVDITATITNEELELLLLFLETALC